MASRAQDETSEPGGPESDRSGSVEGAYQAVVFFHGIGEQRRYAEIGRLIDALDLFAQDGRAPGDETGSLRRIIGRFDVGRGEDDAPDVGHAELRHVSTRQGNEGVANPFVPRFRFYEAYWAPQAAGGVPAHEVLRWVARHLLRPLRLVFTRWRSHMRLRKTFLHGLRAELGDDLWRELLRGSWSFEGVPVRSEYPEGSFRQFKAFLNSRAAGLTNERSEPGRPGEALIDAARKWRRRILVRASVYQLVLMTVVLAAAIGFSAVASAVLWLLNAVSGEQWLVDSLGERARPSGANALALTGIVIMQLGLRTFLSRAFGDVVFWASHRETDARHRIRQEMLRVGTRTLRQVLEDERCARVVVVAHSLGTTIAYEALLELGKYNRARSRDDPGRGPLAISKLDQFVTLGSPLDKLHYFVESHDSPGHRYNRLYEELHGDIGTEPFSRNRKPRIHWINVWSKADLISGPLESPMSMEHSAVRPVNNVEAAMTRFPDPIASHSGYFSHEPTVRLMFDTIVRGRWSYVRPVRREEDYNGQAHLVPDYDKSDVPSLGLDRMARFVQAWLGALVWGLGLYWAAEWIALPPLATSVLGWGVLVSAAFIVLWVGASRLAGLIEPLRPVAAVKAGRG